MAQYNADVIIFGAGIAGLWTFHQLKTAGYNVLLLEKTAIGAGQTIASQGIIHSGLKYKLRGEDSDLAKNIAAMPNIWRKEFKNKCDASQSQILLIPGGLKGRLIKMGAKKMLAGALDVSKNEWPATITNSGFNGSVIAMEEPVLNIPKVLRALAEPYKDSIRKIGAYAEFITDADGSIEGVRYKDKIIRARVFIFTCAGDNHRIATQLGHDAGLETQARPLLMGMMKNVPFPLFAHFVGMSEKPIATITTHQTADGKLVWYVGAAAAERQKNSPERDTYNAMQTAIAHYLPDIDLWNIEWAALPIDRIEGKSGDGRMPDTPSIHESRNALYAWPTKLTFAPLLGDMIMDALKKRDIAPSNTNTDWSFMGDVSFADAPWDYAQWKKFY